MTDVVILNAGGQQVLGRVTLKHAIGMLYRQVARVHEAVPGETFGPYPVPRSLELVRYVYTRWVYEATGRVPYSKTGVLRRDHSRCVYCGHPATTIDHIVPRSRGGRSTWLNCVAACVECNRRKGNLTVKEAGVKLAHAPFVPTLAALQPRWT
jgi:hypothetical protein